MTAAAAKPAARAAAPRIYCIAATAAPVVAVFRRGPSNWSQLGRWDLERDAYEPGAWLRGRIFPRRSDLSPDGRLLCYFAHKPGAAWDEGEAYVAVSRLPWLTALHAFATCGTWTRGYRFTAPGAGERVADAPLPMRWGLASITAEQFATERRRGWTETPDSPPRAPGDAWDQQRNARLHKRQPEGDAWLHVESIGHAGGEFGRAQAVDGLRVQYALEAGGAIELLDDAQWADWDDWNRQGRLLVATRSGRLELRWPGTQRPPQCVADLAALAPDPAPAPDWARQW